MTPKLIFLDVDGTLAEPGTYTVPESAQNAVRAARAAGHRVFLCTGRNYGMLKPLLSYGFDGYIGSAGGYVVCGGKVIYDCPMTPEQSERVLTLLKDNGIYRTVETLEVCYGDEGAAEYLGRAFGANSEAQRMRRMMEEELGVRPMHEYDGRPVYKVLFLCADAAQLAPVRAALAGEFHAVVQDVFEGMGVNGELINRAFDKGSGVRRVAEALGVPLSETIGFGDSLNDLEMMETVGFGVCMANGSEGLKRASDMICPSLEEDGLAKAFETLRLV